VAAEAEAEAVAGAEVADHNMRTHFMSDRRRSNSRRGAAMIEFALVVLLFLVFLFGIIDWSWAFFQQQTIMWGASDAARWAAANRVDQTSIRNIVLCGTPSCTGSATGMYQNATILGEHISTTDVIDSITTVTRYYVRVTVSGYQISLVNPMLSGTYTGKSIVATQPMECRWPNGDCTDWFNPPPAP